MIVVRTTTALTIAAAIAMLAGCGARETAAQPASSTVSTTSVAPSVPSYSCGGIPVALDLLSGGRTADTLGADGRAALQGQGVRPIEEPGTWTVLIESSEELALIRPSTHPEAASGYEIETVVRVPKGPRANDPEWATSTSGGCDLDREPDVRAAGLGPVTLRLDPARPPSEDGMSVGLLVQQRDCTSNQDVQERGRVVETTSTADSVQVLLGVESVPGFFDCALLPPVPYLLELDEPLAGRALMDGFSYPPRPVEVPDEAKGWS